MKLFLLLLGLCFPAYALAMLTPDEIIAQGNESFNSGQYETALAYYTRAAERGNRSAQLQLSVWYLSGQPIAPNLKLGQYWLKEAVKPRATGIVDLLGVSISASTYQSQLTPDLAIAWLILGAHHSDENARYLLFVWYAGLLTDEALKQQTLTWLNTLNRHKECEYFCSSLQK